MTDAVELLRQGEPDAALQSLQALVRAEPADAKHRVFLFQLLCVLGQWGRALTQLNVAGELDAGTLGMVQVYREALSSEALRSEVFAGRRSPLVFGQPEPWIALVLEALRLGTIGQSAQSSALREQAFEQAPTTSGRIDGQDFEWIADADPRLGPILEVVVNGRYYWVPFHRIAEIRLETPVDLRDLVWMPAEFKWANGGEAVGLIPARYPGSESSDDPLVRLARKTEWIEAGEALAVGRGQRMLATDAEEYPLLEIKSLVLNSAPAADASSANAPGG
jgi:type VI secretion system protein ImpE